MLEDFPDQPIMRTLLGPAAVLLLIPAVSPEKMLLNMSHDTHRKIDTVPDLGQVNIGEVII